MAGYGSGLLHICYLPHVASDIHSRFICPLPSQMSLRVGNVRGAEPIDRRNFWVAPPVVHVVNRHSPAEVPLNLSVIVARTAQRVEISSFTKPISTLSEDTGSALALDTSVPPFFKVHVYVWNDTTLREIVEEVMHSSAAARCIFLSPTSSISLPSHSQSDQKGDESTDEEYNDVIDARSECEVEIRHENDVEKLTNGESSGRLSNAEGDSVSSVPPLKRGRVEVDVSSGDDDDDNQEEEVRPQRPATEIAEDVSDRSTLQPPSTVRVLRAFVDDNRRPQIDNITALRIDKPVFHKGDFITIKELRFPRKGLRGWRSGDMLVLVPVFPRNLATGR
ncbi:hypothetical protein TRVL_07954 [Trypanosoma vivax]|uniref:Uncharacterized protein n=1 Tax=Trypanosoma vivax (strain Y486) TaxID=1055687 RepID=G0U2B0_TRYVY|nr:hypothetical protein TRVL_07954 [Trypanosoma vivax]CCC50413.1 conserved hypothetical protein [Trypanosoma vivax Y486]